jgi:hypothetical protein
LGVLRGVVIDVRKDEVQAGDVGVAESRLQKQPLVQLDSLIVSLFNV